MLKDFFIIIFVQAVTLLGFYFRYNRIRRLGVQELLISALYGVVLGALFDILLSMLGLYTYRSTSPMYQSIPWGLSPLQLIVNGIFSFGLCVAAAYYITPQAKTCHSMVQRRIVIVILLGVIIASVVTLVFCKHPLVLLFAAGLSIVAAGELVLIVRSKIGLFLSILLTREYITVMRVWCLIMLIGVICEVVNYYASFWIWLPHNNEYPRYLLELLISIFGYIALVHPMIVMWQVRGVHTD
jgi:hypothetical protein